MCTVVPGKGKPAGTGHRRIALYGGNLARDMREEDASNENSE
jgi:hypothetical protein